MFHLPGLLKELFLLHPMFKRLSNNGAFADKDDHENNESDTGGDHAKVDL